MSRRIKDDLSVNSFRSERAFNAKPRTKNTEAVRKKDMAAK